MSITDPFNDEIHAAYRSLGDSLAPPLDAAERISRRVVVRRRRRRAAIAGTGGVTALALVGSVLVLSGGDDPDGSAVATDPIGHSSTLVMTRPDGSTYTFNDVTVSCKPPEAYGEQGTDTPGHIYMFSPIELTGPVDQNGGNPDVRAVQPFVTFEGIVDKIQGDRTITFPNDWSMATEDMPAILFMADTDGNEVASSAGGESGTIRVLEASCSPKPVLRLEVDMTLGSEVEQNPLDVAGVLR